MIKLNLETKGKEQELIKEYLENNVSETLAEKINNGTKIIKDNLQLINKKDLSGFMTHAGQEARKQSEQGSSCACIEDTVVYGWAIHYFEEDSIEGTLFNEDGSPYTPAKIESKTKTTSKPTTKTKSKTEDPKDEQTNFFDILITETPVETVVEEQKAELIQVDNQLIDISTGEIVNINNNEDIAKTLNNILDNNLEVIL